MQKKMYDCLISIGARVFLPTPKKKIEREKI